MNAKTMPDDVLSAASSLRWEAGPNFHDSLMEAIYTDATRDCGPVRHPQRSEAPLRPGPHHRSAGNKPAGWGFRLCC